MLQYVGQGILSVVKVQKEKCHKIDGRKSPQVLGSFVVTLTFISYPHFRLQCDSSFKRERGLAWGRGRGFLKQLHRVVLMSYLNATVCRVASGYYWRIDVWYGYGLEGIYAFNLFLPISIGF